jgi:hypothetical protein
VLSQSLAFCRDPSTSVRSILRVVGFAGDFALEKHTICIQMRNCLEFVWSLCSTLKSGRRIDSTAPTGNLGQQEENLTM